MKTWIGLEEAIRMIIRSQGVGEELSSFASVNSVTHTVIRFSAGPLPDEQERVMADVHGTSWGTAGQMAGEARKVALEFLRNHLPKGIIRGEGLHEDSGLRGAITESEWATRYIDFWDGQLQNPQGGTRRGYPWITEVEISAADVQREFEAAKRAAYINAKASGVTACLAWLVALRKSGPQPKTKDQMFEEAREKFGVGRGQFDDTWSSAKIKAPNGKWGLSGRPKTVTENHDTKTVTSEKP